MGNLQGEVYLLIKQFVQRQKVPAEMIQKYQSHLSDTKRSIDRSDIKVTSLGYWGQEDEWEYFLYAQGCKVTHKVTGEVIQWNAPDVGRFAVPHFMEWLVWRLTNHRDDSTARLQALLASNPQQYTFQQEILGILEQLHQAGKLAQLGRDYILIRGVDSNLRD